MPQRIVVHAGFHKTGTTTVQRTLQAEREALAPWLQIVLREDMRAVCDTARAYSIHRNAGALKVFADTLDRWLAARAPSTLPLHFNSEDLCGHLPGRHGLMAYDAAPTLMATMAERFRQHFGADIDLRFYFSTRAASAWLASCHWQHLRVTRLADDLEHYSLNMARSAELDCIVDAVRTAVAPHPVHARALEDLSAQPQNGLLQPIFDLLELPAAPRQRIRQRRAVNTRADQDTIDRLLSLNRSPMRWRQLVAEKHSVIAESRRRRAAP